MLIALINYWTKAEDTLRKKKAHINTIFHLGDKQTREGVVKPLEAVNKEIKTCQEAIKIFQ